MRFGFCLFPATVFAGIALLAAPSPLRPQEPGYGLRVAATEAIPDAPQPQIEIAFLEEQAAAGQSQSAPQTASNPIPAQNLPAQGSSSSQTPAPQPGAQKEPARQGRRADQGAGKAAGIGDIALVQRLLSQ
jgi:hypothetical protein